MHTDLSTSVKFSFIVPAYNVAPYLSQCLESILSQTYRNFEIIIIDDGSTDNTADVANNFALKDSRIRVIHQQNGGLSRARNTGFKNAKGDWLIFIDGDDFWQNTNDLEYLFNEIKSSSECDFIGFNCSYYYPSSDTFQQWVPYCDTLSIVQRGEECIDNLVKSGTFPMSACLKVIKHSFLTNNNIYFIPDLYSEDIPWFIEILTKSQAVKFVNLYIYGYRKEITTSISSSFSEKKFTDLQKIVIDGITHTNKENNALMSFWAYEYCILLGMLTFFPKKKRKEKLQELKELSYLLSYKLNPKVRKVAMLKSLIGFKLTVKALGLFIRRKMR